MLKVFQTQELFVFFTKTLTFLFIIRKYNHLVIRAGDHVFLFDLINLRLEMSKKRIDVIIVTFRERHLIDRFICLWFLDYHCFFGCFLLSCDYGYIVLNLSAFKFAELKSNRSLSVLGFV